MFPVEKIARIVEGELHHGGSDSPVRAIHDSRLVRQGDLFIALPGQQSDGHLYLADAFARGACAAIVSDIKTLPSNARNLIVVDEPGLALQELASAWRDTLSSTVVAITGSNGKTTVKGLLGHMLTGYASTYVSPRNYNTEIGVPIALLSMPADARFGVFELGAERSGDIASLSQILKPQIAIITTVGPAHLDGFNSIDAVAVEKWSLVESLPTGGTAIVNGDSPHLLERASTARIPVVTTGLNAGDIRGQVVQSVPNLEVSLDTHNITLTCCLIGAHNASNLLLAATAAHTLGMDWNLIASQIRAFPPIPHRLQPIQASFGTILDDTYNANPASMAAALQVLATFGSADSARAFVFGDMLGLGENEDHYHREIARLASSLPIDTILPVGQAATAACRAVDTSRLVVLPQEDIVRHLTTGKLGPEAVVLIKGSRALELENLVEELRLDR